MLCRSYFPYLGDKSRHPAAVLLIGITEAGTEFALFKGNRDEREDAPHSGSYPHRRLPSQQTCAKQGKKRPQVPRMPNSSVNSVLGNFARARQLGLSDQTRHAQILFHPPEDPYLKKNECESQGNPPYWRGFFLENIPAIRHESHHNRRPGEQKPPGKCRLLTMPPETNPRMQNEPIERYRQLHEEDNGGQPFEKCHGQIVVERPWRHNVDYRGGASWISCHALQPIACERNPCLGLSRI